MPNGFPEPLTAPEAITRSNPVSERRNQSTDIARLYAIGARLNALLEWDELLKVTLDAARQLCHADGASLMLLDEHRQELYIAAAHNLPMTIVSETRVKLGEGVTGWVAKTHQSLLLLGPLRADAYPEAYPKPDIIGSSLCVPLVLSANGHAPKLVGVLNLSRVVEGPPFTHEDLGLCEAFGAQAGVALQNARRFRQMRRHAIQLENLVEISQNLIATLDVEIVLRSIVDKAVELLHCQAGSLLLVDDDTQELIFKVAVGPAGERLLGMRLPPGAGIAGAVAKGGRPLIVHNVKSDPRHYPAVDANTSLTTETILCVPLSSKEHVIGVIEVMNKIDGTAFSVEDQDLLVAFAVQSAIALENARLYSDLKTSFTDTVRIIANAVEARDPYTAGHTSRVTDIALDTAREMGWSRTQIEVLEVGALLHDIGKIGVRDMILRKPTGLTEDEYIEMKRHPILGAQMLEGVSALGPMLPYILYHQERYDGRGYPFGLGGTEIPLEGRLLAVADTFDAMTSDRPYRKGLSVETALAEIQRNRGTQFDPDVVDALMRVHAKGKLISPGTPEHKQDNSSEQ